MQIASSSIKSRKQDEKTKWILSNLPWFRFVNDFQRPVPRYFRKAQISSVKSLADLYGKIAVAWNTLTVEYQTEVPSQLYQGAGCLEYNKPYDIQIFMIIEFQKAANSKCNINREI